MEASRLYAPRNERQDVAVPLQTWRTRGDHASADGESGSRNAQLRWTGPAVALALPVACRTAAPAVVRTTRAGIAGSGHGMLAAHRV